MRSTTFGGSGRAERSRHEARDAARGAKWNARASNGTDINLPKWPDRLPQ